jgi:glycolate oxidase FAD binding subunit
MTTHNPTSEAEAAAVVADAVSRRIPLSITGGGTKRGLGRATQTQDSLSSLALTGITLYEPAELAIAARSGTPLAEIEAALAAKGQHLPFEPMDYRELLGTSGEPTIGGMAAANLSGPRRIKAGACRDAFLGARFINGKAEIIKAGGRVMKNVTGLDLARLMAGAFGTLGFLTEVTFKVLPKPETEVTLALHGFADARAVEALSAGLGSPFEISGAAHLPAGIGGGDARALLRIEGFASVVAYRSTALADALKPFGSAEFIAADASRNLWRSIRDATFLAEPRSRAVWRISVAPTQGPLLVENIRAGVDASWFYDWGGGLVWLACPAEGDAGAGVVHDAARKVGGHATLVRAPETVRAAVDVFQPQTDAVMRLSRRIKESFDPLSVFESGRMYAGM